MTRDTHLNTFVSVLLPGTAPAIFIIPEIGTHILKWNTAILKKITWQITLRENWFALFFKKDIFSKFTCKEKRYILQGIWQIWFFLNMLIYLNSPIKKKRRKKKQFSNTRQKWILFNFTCKHYHVLSCDMISFSWCMVILLIGTSVIRALFKWKHYSYDRMFLIINCMIALYGSLKYLSTPLLWDYPCYP